MTARIYTWKDVNGPKLTPGGSESLVASIRKILMACLVDGYAGKPAAGWSVVHDVNGGFSLTNANKSGIVNFVLGNGLADTNPNYMTVFLLESATDLTAKALKGENRRSYAYSASNTGGQLQTFHTSYPSDYYAHLRRWTLVADENTFVLSYSQGYTTTFVDDGFEAVGLYCGEYINANGLTGPACFCALGGDRGAASSPSYPLRYGSTFLRDPNTGLIPGGAMAVEVYPLSPLTNLPQLGTPSNLYQKVSQINPVSFTMWYGGNVGRMKGILFDPLLSSFSLYYAGRILGLPENDEVWGSVVNLNGVNLAPCGTFKWRFFTDHPDYW